MGDVTDWLRSLGLERYAPQFAEQEIDLATLPLLTDAHLAQLGLPIGPRARVLAAIESLRAQPATVTTADAPLDDAQVIDPAEGERRRITILFADLADSTKLAARLDPEDLRTLMQQYQQACAQVIEHHTGHIAQYMGDGIMAYFGWPSAHEDAAERAVRAGLDLVAAVKALRSAEPLTVRVGINTGTVVISDTGHGDPSIPQAAVGVTPHIAARLQSLAPPNAVLISVSTSQLVGGLCEQEALGPQQLKGVGEPVPVFRVTQMHNRRFLSARARGLTPFVGRQAELALLQQRWRDAQDGEGQLVYVSGVPGIGKSRIVHELEQRIAETAQFRLKFQCAPHDAQSPLRPIIRGLAWAAELRDDDTNAVKLTKIRRLLELSTERIEAAMPPWADLFTIPLARDHGTAGTSWNALSAQQKKDQTLFLLAAVLAGLSRRGTVLCVLEDAQWIDPSTQELLELLPAHLERAGVLFVVTHRPDYQPRLGERGKVSTLAIARLSRRDMLALARQALQAHAAGDDIVQRIVEQSDAVPLFAEELARNTVESISARTSALPSKARETDNSAVPDALRDGLVARLDRVPQGRHIAQAAAVIGREFSHSLLRRITQLDESALDTALAQLIRSQILVMTEREPVARYGFTHALLRDVAYESLLRSTRRELHARIAQALQADAPDIARHQPELLAYHLREAGDTIAAVRYWIAGARQARARWANREAIDQLRSARLTLSQALETAERDHLELEITLLLGLCLITVEGYSSPGAREAFERARELSERRADPQRSMQALFGLWGHHWMGARHDQALALGRALMAQAHTLGTVDALTVAHRALGSTLFTAGEFIDAREHLTRAIVLAGQTVTTSTTSGFAVDPRIAAQLLLAWDLWILGHPDQALARVNEALDWSLASDDPYSSAFAHYVTSAVNQLRGEARTALEHAERSNAISTEHRIGLYALYSQFGRGCARALLDREGRHDDPAGPAALDDIRAGIKAAQASELGYLRAFMLGSLAQVLMDRGDFDSARTALDEAQTHVDDVAGRAWEAEILRLRGDLARATAADSDAIARCYIAAIDVAHRQQARALELRAATSLAQWHIARGAAAAARSLLAPITLTFDEGLDTADVRAARAVLASLH